MINRTELLNLLSNNARLSADELAVMLGSTHDAVDAELKALETEKIILGYTTEIDWTKTEDDSVVAMIEVKITPVRNKGFDHIADILCKYDNVMDCWLMSGGFDLMLMYKDKDIRNIASFVYNKVATLEGVVSTATHFMLKKYKSNGIIVFDGPQDDRQAVVL